MRVGAKAVLAAVAALLAGCSAPERTLSRNEDSVVERPWSLKDLPSPKIPDETLTRLTTAKAHHLSFERNSQDWDLADIRKTDAQMNRTDVVFVLNGVAIGKGNQGLANLRHLLLKLPAGTVVRTDHCLGCQKNRWSRRIKRIQEESWAATKVRVECDGAF